MTPLPRHRQRAITFRSDKAAELLARLARSGKSQAEIIEDALSKAVEGTAPLTREEMIARIDAIIRPAHGLGGPRYRELRKEIYDENGLPV